VRGDGTGFLPRVRRAGLTSAVDAGLTVSHCRAGSVDVSLLRQVYLMTRNDIRVLHKRSTGLWSRLPSWPAAPLRVALNRARRGAQLARLIGWIGVGAWDARRSPVFRAGEGRAEHLLLERAESE
jgi:GT2 family glycosyltransferase